MTPRLEAVLARLCQRVGPLFKTQAVKLPYLVDVVAMRALGRPITEGHHQTWELGVVTSEVFHAIQRAEVGERFQLEEHAYSESGRRVRLVGGMPENVLSPDEEAIADHVADLYGRLPAEQLGLLTKLLNTELPPDTWGSNAEARVDEEAYARLDASWQRFGRRLPEQDLDDRRLWSEPVQGDPMNHLRRSLA